MKRLELTDEQREFLKRPLGELLRGSPNETLPMLATIVEGEKPVLIVAVGDAVSRTMLSAGVRVDVMVIDHREQRQPVGGFAPKKQKLIHAFNRPGTIDPAAVQAVSDAVNHGNAVVTIEGEEDLLTLPAVLSAPIGAMVVYGQPNEGIVVVRIDSKKKSEIRGIVDSMSAV